MGWVIAAFAAVWIAVFVYVIGLDRKQCSLAAEIEDLRAKLG
ncbi:MAG: CcmD family protein [Candidatus Krumholzibacteria bacterium]|nr:CcmD family protein [Candidatus Krumholzibacteria bacterium]